MTQENKNLTPSEFGKDIDWSKPTEAVEYLCKFADTECSQAIEWYFSKKHQKAKLGSAARLCSIVAVTAAGVIPIIGEIFEKDDKPLLSPAWATVALAIAALFIAFDRFGGHTSGWVRYIRTGMALSQLQGNFRIGWAEQRLSAQVVPAVPGTGSDPIKDRIQLCRDFLIQMNALVGSETDEWAREFQTALVEIDKLSQDGNKKS